MDRGRKVERGDWQTPLALARAVVREIDASRRGAKPASVLEPTCGAGSFLVAARDAWPRAALRGVEIDPAHARAACRALGPGNSGVVRVANFFDVDWARTLARLPDPLLVLGNPPWVTSAALGARGAKNLPVKSNLKGLSGLDALTGSANFDVSEWMILHLLERLRGREATLAMLCKSAVARRVIEHIARQRWEVGPGRLVRIDAAAHFGVAVDAVLLVAHTGVHAGTRAAAQPSRARWPIHEALGRRGASRHVAFDERVGLVAHAAAFARTKHLARPSDARAVGPWRSGLKHDCARVMELAEGDGALVNGLGARVDVEEAVRFPLLKSSDLANGRLAPRREVLVPQRALNEDTAALAKRAPRAFAYLSSHAALLGARKSSIYRGRAPFSVFGVGPYTFAPWKVAVSGLYKRLAFEVVGPHGGRPVVFDDTCYFLAFDDEREARAVARALASDLAHDFFAARIFWDAKRPITKAVLDALDLDVLLEVLAR